MNLLGDLSISHLKMFFNEGENERTLTPAKILVTKEHMLPYFV